MADMEAEAVKENERKLYQDVRSASSSEIVGQLCCCKGLKRIVISADLLGNLVGLLS